jgi:hypothetical protein
MLPQRLQCDRFNLRHGFVEACVGLHHLFEQSLQRSKVVAHVVLEMEGDFHHLGHFTNHPVDLLLESIGPPMILQLPNQLRTE